MKIQTLFDDYLDSSALVSINGSPVYTQRAEVFKPFLEYDIKSICPVFRGCTACLDIRTIKPVDLSELKLKFL